MTAVNPGAILAVVANLLSLAAELAKAVNAAGVERDIRKVLDGAGIPTLPDAAREHAERARKLLEMQQEK